MSSYNPDLFSFNIEVHLIKSLFHLCSALLEGIEHLDITTVHTPSYVPSRGEQTSYLQNGLGVRGSASVATGVRFSYDAEFWKRIPVSITTVQEYLTKAIGRMVNNQELYSKAVVNLSMFSYCAEAAFQSTLSNAVFCPPTTGELSQSSCSALEMSYLLLVLLIQAFDNTDKSVKLYANEAIRRSKNDAASLLGEYEQVNRATMSFRPGSVLNKASVGGHFSARRMEDEDSEDRYYLTFIRKYFPLGS